MKRVIILFAAMMLCIAGTGQADIAAPGSIASWNQYGQAGNQASTAAVVDPSILHIAPTVMSRSGLNGNTGSNSLNSSNWTSGGYVQFGLAVDPGYHANLGSLYFGSYASATGPKTLEVRTSADNYQSVLYSISEVQYPSYIDPVVDLSTLGNITGNFNIRIYGTGATSSNGTLRLTDFYSSDTGYYYDSITGSVAQDATPTPLPAAAWLLGSGLAGLVGIKKKIAA